jgi:ribosome-binding ATPase
MNLSVGIVGLPNVGKSTLFNALLKKQQALAANYPFATIEPNIGVVPVPDERLDRLAEITKTELGMSSNPPIKPATVEFVDIAGLVKGASEGEGLGNKFLSHIREVKIIAHVVRVFEDGNVVREGSSDPKSDYEIIRTELGIADLDAKGDKLTDKKEIIVLNVAEDMYSDGKNIETIKNYSETLGIPSDRIIVVCAKVESELAELGEEDSKLYLKEFGVEKSGLERLIQKAYQELGLISFLTAGEKEVRAWTIKRGSNALEAAGEIHTDFMQKFIKAEAVSYSDFIEHNGWKGSRNSGKARLEGRDYIMQNGDVVEYKIGR